MTKSKETFNVKNQDQPLLNWQSINWRKVNKTISDLRGRIYRASAKGDMKRVGNLQKLMLRSHANKLLAIRRVTQTNQGKNTSGVDKIVVKTDKERGELYKQLTNLQLGHPYPVKRVHIPKKTGKLRPLGIPAVVDRCKQAIVKSALEPYWEAKFEPTSYGFRPGRSAHDAIERIFRSTCKMGQREYILEADIKGAFDNIDHSYILRTIGNFPGKQLIKQWLEAGYMEGNRMHPTETGCPQGGIISPLLCNIALHGMAKLLGIQYDDKGQVPHKSPYNLIFYADDFVVLARSKEECEQAKHLIKTWLSERGFRTFRGKNPHQTYYQGI